MGQRAVGPLYVRGTAQLLETGFVVDGHLHNFDHVTFFMSGTWRVDMMRGSEKLATIELQGGGPESYLLIRADVWHRLTLIKGPGAYNCVYPHRTEDGRVSETYTGWEAAHGIPAAG